MHTSLLKIFAVAAAVCASPFVLLAQGNGDDQWNHFGMDARIGFNIRATFSGEGAMAAPPPPSAGGAANRIYNDGFVKKDVSGNQGGLTWNWGYQNASQVPGNDTLLMHASSSAGASTSRSDDPSLGFELTYLRDLAHEEWGSWGVKFAFGYTRINLEDNQPQTANASLITDTYQLNGVQPPLAPYNGSFNGPGPVISSTPSRSATALAGGEAIVGTRSLNTSLYDIRIGPSADIRIAGPWSLQVGGGLALGIADGKFSFTESATTSGGSVLISGNSHDTSCLVGAYVEAEIAYRCCRSGSVFAGLEYEYLEDYSQSVAGHTAKLDLGQAYYLKAGFQLHF